MPNQMVLQIWPFKSFLVKSSRSLQTVSLGFQRVQFELLLLTACGILIESLRVKLVFGGGANWKRLYGFCDVWLDKVIVVVLVDCVGAESAIEGWVDLLDLVDCFDARVLLIRFELDSSWIHPLFGLIEHRWDEMVWIRFKIHNMLLRRCMLNTPMLRPPRCIKSCRVRRSPLWCKIADRSCIAPRSTISETTWRPTVNIVLVGLEASVSLLIRAIIYSKICWGSWHCL